MRTVVVIAILGLLFACQAEATICTQKRIELERVQGIVLDDEGRSLLPGVVLTLSRVGGTLERTETADGEGFFSFTSVPDGDYHFSAQLDGFLTLYAEIRVTTRSHLGQVLIAHLTQEFDGCGALEMATARKARRLQRTMVNRGSR